MSENENNEVRVNVVEYPNQNTAIVEQKTNVPFGQTLAGTALKKGVLYGSLIALGYGICRVVSEIGKAQAQAQTITNIAATDPNRVDYIPDDQI